MVFAGPAGYNMDRNLFLGDGTEEIHIEVDAVPLEDYVAEQRDDHAKTAFNDTKINGLALVDRWHEMLW